MILALTLVYTQIYNFFLIVKVYWEKIIPIFDLLTKVEKKQIKNR